jgi:UDP-3-O-[3-hydroxymyristoyl] glucosamine N-acyltransferase
MMRTARELAQFLEAELVGDGDRPVRGLAGPEQAGPDDLIYCDSERHRARAEGSRAGTAIVPPGVSLAGKSLLRAPQPKLAFARAATLLVETAPLARGIHPTAVIAPTARLAPNVAIGPYAVIEDEVEIGAGSEIAAHCVLGQGSRLGERCRLYPRVTLYAGARLGNRVILHSGTVIGADGFGYVRAPDRQWKFPQVGGVEIADDVEIGANSTIDRGSLGVTRIQKDVKIDNLVQIAHNVEIGEHVVVAAQTGISGSSTVERNAIVGGQVGMGDHCLVEEGAVCGSGSGILPGKKIRRGQVVWGVPARPLDEFKRQYAWFARLPELAERLKRLEQKLGAEK